MQPQLPFQRSTLPAPPVSFTAGLLQNPPRTSGELLLRIDGFDPHALGAQLIELLRAGEVDVDKHFWLSEALTTVGIEQHWDDLAEILAAPGTGPRIRALVQVVLMEVDLPRATGLVEALPDSLADELLIGSFATFFADLEHGGIDSSSLADLLEGLPPEGLSLMFDRIDQLRADSGLPAAVAWSALLRRRSLRALHPRALDVLIEEGGSEAEELLEALRARAGGKKARRVYDKALMTIRTRDVNRRAAPGRMAGRCWVSPCDGQGAFVAIMAGKATGGRTRVSDIVVRVSAELRDGFLIPETDEGELEELLTGLRGQFPMEQAPLPEVAALVMQGLRRGKAAGVKLSKDVRLGLRAFEKAHRKHRAELESLPPTSPVEPEQYRRLLRELSGWFLDSGDLLGQGIDEPPWDEGPTPEWVASAARRLQGGPVQARLLAMTEYQSRWFGWVKDEELMGICAAAHAELSGDLRKSAFVAELLVSSAELLDEEDGELDVSDLGDPKVRSKLRAYFFSGVVTATGRDLAHLDYTEAADIVLDRAVKALPGELRPSADQQRSLAHQLGCLWIDIDLRAFDSLAAVDDFTAPQDFEEAATALLQAELGLGTDDAEMVAEDLDEVLAAFRSEVCSECEVNCLARSDRDHTRLFHSTQYPPHIGDC